MENTVKKIPHSVILDDRNKLTVTGITEVGNFDEENIILYTQAGELEIKGESLQVNVLNVETGQFSAQGKIISLSYSEKKQKGSGFFGKVFR